MMYEYKGFYPKCPIEKQAEYARFFHIKEDWYEGETYEEISRLTRMSLCVFMTCFDGYVVAIDSRMLDSEMKKLNDETDKFMYDRTHNVLITACGTTIYQERETGKIIEWKTIVNEAMNKASCIDDMPRKISDYMYEIRCNRTEMFFIDIEHLMLYIIQSDGKVLDYKMEYLYKRMFHQGMSLVSTPEYLYYSENQEWPLSFEHATKRISDYFEFSEEIFELCNKRYQLDKVCPFGGRIRFFYITKDKRVYSDLFGTEL